MDITAQMLQKMKMRPKTQLLLSSSDMFPKHLTCDSVPRYPQYFVPTPAPAQIGYWQAGSSLQRGQRARGDGGLLITGCLHSETRPINNLYRPNTMCALPVVVSEFYKGYILFLLNLVTNFLSLFCILFLQA